MYNSVGLSSYGNVWLLISYGNVWLQLSLDIIAFVIMHHENCNIFVRDCCQKLYYPTIQLSYGCQKDWRWAFKRELSEYAKHALDIEMFSQ